MSDKSKPDFLHSEAQRTLDNQIERSQEITEQAYKLFRLYLLAAGAIGAIIARGSNSEENGSSLLSAIQTTESPGVVLASLLFGSVLIATALAALAISAWDSGISRGPGSKDLKSLIKSKNSSRGKKRELLSEGYIRWIENLSNRNYKRQQMLKYGYRFSIIGAVLLLTFLAMVV